MKKLPENEKVLAIEEKNADCELTEKDLDQVNGGLVTAIYSTGFAVSTYNDFYLAIDTFRGPSILSVSNWTNFETGRTVGIHF